jgi:hypothetical protein
MKKVIIGVTAAMALLAASLWATSLALEPAGIGVALAPEPADHPEPVIQVYGADVWGFRGKFAIHTWIATKGQDEPEYTIHQVIGWRLRRGRSVVARSSGDPARPWYGSPAVLLHEVRGPGSQQLVDRVRAAVAAYPYPDDYKMWPGPNSNSFMAWVGLEVPELGLELPAKAIGQSWMISNHRSATGSP